MKGYDLDFLAVGPDSSGDSILVRTINNDDTESVMLVDGGFSGTAVDIKNFMSKHYNSSVIDNMVLTHVHQDHISGLISLIRNDEVTVKKLWAIFPWDFTNELINLEYFKSRSSANYLFHELKRNFPKLKELEDIAVEKGIKIKTPFAGAMIGDFRVLSPTKEFYFENISSSQKTAAKNNSDDFVESVNSVSKGVNSVIDTIKEAVSKYACWGHEVLTEEDTDAENNNSVVLYSELCGTKILLTGDAGKSALNQVVAYLKQYGEIAIDIFKVPHHGSRHNLSLDILDSLFGPKIASQKDCMEKFTAVVSAAKNDKKHPRNVIVRALMHRGAKVYTTKNGWHRQYKNTDKRPGAVKSTPMDYPTKFDE
ncbi:MBL fold metallo-hydrolase [Enterobacteriaceae bacterium RIT711]|nr:MBL fold metallo-hydrolase [Enterobacteriaceae bacterium RIT711]